VVVHKFHPKIYHDAFGTYEPVLQINDDDTVWTSTLDNEGRDSSDCQVTTTVNPLTGPFYVKGLEPGDIIAVHLDELQPNRHIGRSSTVIAPSIVDPKYVVEKFRKIPCFKAEWKLDIEKGIAILDKTDIKLEKLVLPLSPMLGCLGVAPLKGQAISSITSSTYGGNMDYKGIKSGVTVYFPVFVPGGLLFMGDGHALQGDGEIAGTGIEVSFDIQFTVKIIKGKRINWPRAENNEYILTVGNARPLNQALQHATTEMIRWLEDDLGLDSYTSHILLGQCVEYEVGNVFDPAYTIVCKLKKKWLPSVS
jgi:acetamidase/formamidase